ncbi:MAG TPA: beta-ketoacyl-[acyl-carrier-protein] synthase family protein, partial [Longimicrobiales bacterium]|nr:beta-ketoacyl-[acyl-carrier-protein] synthase family protein [Longimicrobiales bacterium]
MAPRRVLVTGLGLVSPLGNDVAEAFRRLYSGETGVRRVVSDSGMPGGDAIVAPADFELGDAIPRMRARLMARAAQMAVLAAGSALDAAELDPGDEWAREAGIYVGSGLGGSEILENHYRRYFATPTQRSRAATTAMIMANGPASHISMHFGLTGPSLSYSVACVSSAVAVGEAFRAIRDGYLHTAVAGGAEAQLNEGTLGAWMALGALASEHADGPEATSRPFDAQRTGLVLGEGAAVLILESEESVAARGGTALAELVGYGVSSDAHNLTEPLEEGQVLAMRRALADAGLEPGAIGYVNAHATGTPAGDRVEWRAIGTTFGEHAGRLPVSSSKGAHGHLVGATSALEAVWTVLALGTGR